MLGIVMAYVPCRLPPMLGTAFASTLFLVMLFSLILSLAIINLLIFLAGGQGSSSGTKSRGCKRFHSLPFDCFPTDAVDEAYAIIATCATLIERNICISDFAPIRLAGLYSGHGEILPEIV
ncbi:hypothetical protein U1Q18_052443 [Sarracenia purpurea var. burkii]